MGEGTGDGAAVPLSSSPNGATDTELLLVSLEHPTAFGQLFERHYDRLRRYCERRLGRGYGQDVAAETFLVAFASRDRFDPDRGDVLAWLFGIATNLIRRQRRRETAQLRAYARTVDRDRGDIADVDIERDMIQMDEVRIAAAALSRLRGRERDIVLLSAWAELSYEQIARSLAIPVGTVRSRLSRAKSRMRELKASSEARTR